MEWEDGELIQEHDVEDKAHELTELFTTYLKLPKIRLEKEEDGE